MLDTLRTTLELGHDPNNAAFDQRMRRQLLPGGKTGRGVKPLDRSPDVTSRPQTWGRKVKLDWLKPHGVSRCGVWCLWAVLLRPSASTRRGEEFGRWLAGCVTATIDYFTRMAFGDAGTWVTIFHERWSGETRSSSEFLDYSPGYTPLKST